VLPKEPILVTQPYLPPLEEFMHLLQNIWSTKWITNNGVYHEKLEKALQDYLKVPFISLFTNGTIPLIVALQALDINGEVITTPYTFAATTHALWWNNIKPVFVDIDGKTGNLDPNRIEEAITEQTTAIMPVHVYGNPCDIEKIQVLADKYRLKVIYDAAHAFGVEIENTSILTAGDMSTLSFHATKAYNTIEGGALICKEKNIKAHIDHLKNFGFQNEVEILMPGINGKLDELRAAYGLLNLHYVDTVIEKRKKLSMLYQRYLKEIPGITIFAPPRNVKLNYSYFPIIINKQFGMSRDNLYETLKKANIFGRRYFYPLTSSLSPYKELPSANPDNLPKAIKLANTVICLPLYPELSIYDLEYIVDTIALTQKQFR
jgi:dTDP-4-amino-4,6-dideoxygalactose transaminase